MCQADNMAAKPPPNMAAQPPGPSMAPAAMPPSAPAPMGAQPTPQVAPPDPVLAGLLQGIQDLYTRAVAAAPASAPPTGGTTP